MYDERDDTLQSKLDDLKIAYASVIREVNMQCGSFNSRFIKPQVDVTLYKIGDVPIVSLACEGYSSSIVFNNHGEPKHYVDEFADKTLVELFGGRARRLDTKVRNFNEDLKTLNNHIQQLSKDNINELFSI